MIKYNAGAVQVGHAYVYIKALPRVHYVKQSTRRAAECFISHNA